MAADARYVRSGDVVSRVIAGETLAVPVRRGVGDLSSIYMFNEVGGVIWESLSAPIAFHELVAKVCSQFLVQQEQARADVNAFLQEMESAGLVKKIVDDCKDAR